jgi:hypothetical protein
MVRGQLASSDLGFVLRHSPVTTIFIVVYKISKASHCNLKTTLRDLRWSFLSVLYNETEFGNSFYYTVVTRRNIFHKVHHNYAK